MGHRWSNVEKEITTLEKVRQQKVRTEITNNKVRTVLGLVQVDKRILKNNSFSYWLSNESFI